MLTLFREVSVIKCSSEMVMYHKMLLGDCNLNMFICIKIYIKHISKLNLIYDLRSVMCWFRCQISTVRYMYLHTKMWNFFNLELRRLQGWLPESQRTMDSLSLSLQWGLYAGVCLEEENKSMTICWRYPKKLTWQELF